MSSDSAKIDIAPARMVGTQTSYQVSGRITIREHWFKVPVDYEKPEGASIKLFARSACRHEAFPAKPKTDSPWMLFLQGGPGFECRSPQNNAWTDTILNKGYQMLFVDQRGTGLSTAITARTLLNHGAVAVQHAYLKLHRADNIVRDCEAIRKALLPHHTQYYEQKWSVMGQSFGGFCCATYLSFYPEGLQEVFIYGGLPPLVKQPLDVYLRLYRKLDERNRAYYNKFPEDVELVYTIGQHILKGNVILPSSKVLSCCRFQQLGLMLGFHGGLDTLHEIVTRANNDLLIFGYLTQRSLREIENNTAFDDAIIYSLLHESIYCQGEASNWAAGHVRLNRPEYDEDRKPLLFTGEMIYAWMFSEYAELSKVPDVATSISAEEHWPALYDRQQLGRNTVPVYAAVYEDDMYVDVAFSMETARAIRGAKVYRSNVMLHNAIRAKTEEVVNALFKLRDDVSD